MTGTDHLFAIVDIVLAGPNYSLGASASALGGVWGPADCVLPKCVPGATINLDARFSGKDRIRRRRT
jgi:hypothetical protein